MNSRRQFGLIIQSPLPLLNVDDGARWTPASFQKFRPVRQQVIGASGATTTSSLEKLEIVGAASATAAADPSHKMWLEFNKTNVGVPTCQRCVYFFADLCILVLSQRAVTANAAVPTCCNTIWRYQARQILLASETGGTKLELRSQRKSL